jgi:hypothetical protein
MNSEKIKLRITGTRRLIMHSGRLADPLDAVAKDLARLTSKRMKTESDHEAISRVEWHGGLWLDGGAPCLPAEALMATFVSAAKTRRRGAQAGAGMMIERNAKLEYDGPEDMDALWEIKTFRLRVPVRVGANARTMRTRPCFHNWSAEFTVAYLPTLLNGDEVVETFAVAGFTKGIGDWRPQNGTFSVKLIE